VFRDDLLYSLVIHWSLLSVEGVAPGADDSASAVLLTMPYPARRILEHAGLTVSAVTAQSGYPFGGIFFAFDDRRGLVLLLLPLGRVIEFLAQKNRVPDTLASQAHRTAIAG
jgi:hypothetical protein